MLGSKLKSVQVILGSQSPRRKELLASLDIDFNVLVKSVDETIPSTLNPLESAEYLAIKKMQAFDSVEFQESLLITADTVVIDQQNCVLGKPRSREEAIQILASLSGNSHQVLTGVALRYKGRTMSFTEKTIVNFEVLDALEIQYYVDKYQPFDKAGAYGIQEWIGRIAVSHLEGSYENVMGLPTARLYRAIAQIMN